jgi:hypothetical protein
MNERKRQLLAALGALLLGLTIGIVVGRISANEQPPDRALTLLPTNWDSWEEISGEIDRVTVPELRGHGADNVENILRPLGLRAVIVQVGPRLKQGRPPGSVMGQVPPPGTVVVVGTAVTAFTR